MLRLCAIFVLLLPAVLQAADPVSPEDEAFFESKIRPILIAKCLSCHGPDQQKGDVRLDSADALRKGPDGGPLFVAGKPEESRLMEVLSHEDSVKMPPKEKLPAEELASITEWIRRGAPFPATKSSGLSPATPEAIELAKASHWAYQPIRGHELPAVKTNGWAENRVDPFIAAKLEAAGLTPSPESDKATLIRRVTFDLTGLPPTYEEVQAFCSDTRPQAWAELVDRLLASPRYGERWGRHWLDVARYADTKGYVFTEERKYPFSYTYRDYVIDAFNADKPFDQFVREQLAADQLPLGEDKKALAAMGFLTLGRRFGNNINDIIDDRIDVVSRGLLGLAVGCARCHDHKYDPIPTADYYALYGVFAASTEPGDLPLIGEPVQSKEYAAYEAELQQRQKAVDDFVEQKLAEARDTLRTKVGDYLFATTRTDLLRERFRFSVSRSDLRRNVVERWTNYLKDRADTSHPVFGLWNRLAKLPGDKFADQAKNVLAELNTPDAPKLNARLRQAFSSTPPNSLKNAADIYGKVFTAVHEEWKKLRAEKADATVLPDADSEELRQVLYADNAPPNISRDDSRRIFERDVTNQIRDLQRKVDSFKANSPVAPPRAMVLTDVANPPPAARIFERGNPNRPGETVPRRFLRVLSSPDQKFTQGSGRKELAELIASPDNPLTARVIVNRVWMHHFGQGLVRTPSDFGIRGEKPSHPELLDDLARRFIDYGWSLKWLHRQILLSQTYRQQSFARSDTAMKDPENRLLWRMNPRRLEFEAMRDSLLAVSGTLDLTAGGRSVDLFSQPFTKRRTVYGFIDRQDLPGLFRSFDFASPDVSTPQRPQTTIPQQALFTMNSPFVVEQAHRLSKSAREAVSPAEQVARLYRRAYGREPDSLEVEAGVGYLTSAAMGDVLPGDWQYGYGTVDGASGRVAFTRLPHFSEGRWKGGSATPDPTLGFAMLSAQGGHPGSPASAVIRRWTAPQNAILKLQGTLGTAAEQGDGVQGRVISSRQGLLGTWTAHNLKIETKLEAVSVETGETLDFVVDCQANANSDSFTWPVTLEGPRTWNSAREFTGPPASPLSPLDQYAQALLLSNEFVFVD